MKLATKNKKMTFIKGGEFLIKDLEAKDIFIPEEFTEEHGHLTCYKSI